MIDPVGAHHRSRVAGSVDKPGVNTGPDCTVTMLDRDHPPSTLRTRPLPHANLGNAYVTADVKRLARLKSETPYSARRFDGSCTLDALLLSALISSSDLPHVYELSIYNPCQPWICTVACKEL